MLGGMLQQQLVSIFAGLFAKIGQDRDVASDDGLQCGAQIPDHAARSDDDSAYDAVIFDDAVACKFVGCRNHGTIHAIHATLLEDVYRCDSTCSRNSAGDKWFC